MEVRVTYLLTNFPCTYSYYENWLGSVDLIYIFHSLDIQLVSYFQLTPERCLTTNIMCIGHSAR